MATRKDGIGYVYVLYEPLSKAVKVGRTKDNPFVRIKQHCNSIPNPILPVLVAKVDNFGLVEKTIHKAFSKYKYKTEWFIVEPKKIIQFVLDNFNLIDAGFEIPDIIEYRLRYEYDILYLEGLKNGLSFTEKHKIRDGEFNIDINDIGVKVIEHFRKSAEYQCFISKIDGKG